MMAGFAADELAQRAGALVAEARRFGSRSLTGLQKKEGGGGGRGRRLQKISSKVLTVASKRCNNLVSALNKQTARRNKRQVIGWFCEVL
jgi:hypothetical protein